MAMGDLVRMDAALRHFDQWPAGIGLGRADPRSLLAGLHNALGGLGQETSAWRLAACYTILLSVPPELAFDAELTEEVVTQFLGASTADWDPAPVFSENFAPRMARWHASADAIALRESLEFVLSKTRPTSIEPSSLFISDSTCLLHVRKKADVSVLNAYTTHTMVLHYKSFELLFESRFCLCAR